MIHIAIKERNQRIISIEMNGHANTAPKGQDLVCAAASAIILGGINALRDDDRNYSLSTGDGHLRLEVVGEISDRDEIVLETIVAQLSSVMESHPEALMLERN